MARPCALCGHRERAAIERDYLAGDRPATIARTYGVAEPGVRRHMTLHVREAPVSTPTGSSDPEALGKLLVLKALRALRSAEGSGDRAASARALREARESVESLAKLKAEDSRQRFTVERDIVFQALRADLVRILDGFPDAKEAVIVAFGGAPSLPEAEPVPDGDPKPGVVLDTPEAPAS